MSRSSNKIHYRKQALAVRPRVGLNPVQRKQVKRLVEADVETKHYQDGIAPFAVSNSGAIIALSNMPQNTSAAGRIGDSVNLKSMDFNFDCIASQGTLGTWLAGDAYNNLRVILFRWHENSVSSSPSVSSILNTTLGSYTYLAPYNLDNMEAGMFSIMYDRTFILENTPYWNGSTTLFASGQSSIHNVINKKIYGRALGRKKINYNGSALTGTGNIFMLVVSDSAATPHPYAQYAYSINYTDE